MTKQNERFKDQIKQLARANRKLHGELMTYKSKEAQVGRVRSLSVLSSESEALKPTVHVLNEIAFRNKCIQNWSMENDSFYEDILGLNERPANKAVDYSLVFEQYRKFKLLQLKCNLNLDAAMKQLHHQLDNIKVTHSL